MSTTFDLAASDGESMVLGIPCALCNDLWLAACAAENGAAYEDATDIWWGHHENCPTRAFTNSLSSGNAAAMLRTLGYLSEDWGSSEDWGDGLYGDSDGREFLERVRARLRGSRYFPAMEALGVEAALRGCHVGWCG